MHVDYIGYGAPSFEGDDEYFNEIYFYVNEKHHIDINARPLSKSGAFSFTFEFFFKDKTHSFSISSTGESGGDKKEGGGEENKEGEDYEENQAMKQGKNIFLSFIKSLLIFTY